MTLVKRFSLLTSEQRIQSKNKNNYDLLARSLYINPNQFLLKPKRFKWQRGFSDEVQKTKARRCSARFAVHLSAARNFSKRFTTQTTKLLRKHFKFSKVISCIIAEVRIWAMINSPNWTPNTYLPLVVVRQSDVPALGRSEPVALHQIADHHRRRPDGRICRTRSRTTSASAGRIDRRRRRRGGAGNLKLLDRTWI